jgi:aspartate/methionine/tyrosine aminotransferase
MNASPLVRTVDAPPIAEAMTWLKPGPRNRALLNLCQAVPSYPPAEAMQAEIAKLAHAPGTSLYTDILGIPPLRAALAAHMAQDYGGQIGASQVAITSGCNQAFCAVIMAIAAAGDNVIIPAPYYFNHQMWLDMQGIEKRVVPAFTAESQTPLPEAAASLINARTRAIILCSPNNPTGAIYPPEVLARFFALAQRHRIRLIIDETYKDFRPTPEPLHLLFSLSGWENTFIQLYSFSKVFAVTGYRVGSIITEAPLLAEIEKVLDCMAICAPHISQAAVLFALSALDDWKAEKLDLMAARRRAVTAAFARPDLTYRLISSGAYFAYLQHPFAGTPAKQVAQRLAAEHDVLCLPGSMFGPGQDDYLRLAFANAPADSMAELAQRLVESQQG